VQAGKWNAPSTPLSNATVGVRDAGARICPVIHVVFTMHIVHIELLVHSISCTSYAPPPTHTHPFSHARTHTLARKHTEWIKNIDSAAKACLNSEEAVDMHISGGAARGLDVHVGHDSEREGAFDVHVDGHGAGDNKSPGVDLHVEGNRDRGGGWSAGGEQDASLHGLSTRVAEIASVQSTHSRMLSSMDVKLESILAILRQAPCAKSCRKRALEP